MSNLEIQHENVKLQNEMTRYEEQMKTFLPIEEKVKKSWARFR